MVDSNLLINEIQLGVKLNECVHSNRRSDFGLMLAMLTDDAREFSEFLVPGAKPEKEIPSDEFQLRKLLELPESAPISLRDIALLEHYNEAVLANNNNMKAIYLSDVLMPKAIAFRDDTKHIHPDVIGNTSLHTQNRHKLGDEKSPPNKLSFNAKTWLKTVQQSIVSVNPENVHSIA